MQYQFRRLHVLSTDRLYTTAVRFFLNVDCNFTAVNYWYAILVNNWFKTRINYCICDMFEGFGSNCYMNFEGFTNPVSAQRTTLHKTHCGFTVFFSTSEVKPNCKYSSKYLRFLSMATIEMELS